MFNEKLTFKDQRKARQRIIEYVRRHKETKKEDVLVCPYCAEIQKDIKEIRSLDPEIFDSCGRCGSSFEYQVEVRLTTEKIFLFSTRQLSEKECQAV